MSMNLTYVTDAVAAGAKLFADTRVDHLEKDGSGWRILTDNGEFRAERVILAAGIVQTPTILLRSGIAAGQKLQFHLQSLAWGDFDDPVDGFAGIPMAYGVTEFSDVYGHTGPGYVMEGVSVQPIAFGVQTQADGELQQEIMQRYRHLAGVLPLIRSNARGQVTLEARRPKIDYPLIKADAERVRHFYIKAAELFKAAGARRVLLAHRKNRWVQSPDPDIKIAPGMQYLYTAHPFGGACRGTTTDGVGRVQDNNNLWVLDASAFPEALGVNPQITIAALALEGADRILNG